MSCCDIGIRYIIIIIVVYSDASDSEKKAGIIRSTANRDGAFGKLLGSYSKLGGFAGDVRYILYGG